MFSGQSAAHLYAKLHYVRAGGPSATELIWIAVIEKNQRMQVAVSGVKYISDNEAVPFGDSFNPEQRRRELGARDDAIEHVIGGRNAADGAESFFAAFPKQVALASVAGAADFTRVVTPTNIGNFRCLRFDGLARAFHFHKQNCGAIERKTCVNVGFDVAERPAIEHFARRGNNSVGSNIHDGIGGIFERIVDSQKR